MNSLILLDHQLFEKINRVWTSDWADVFFPAITDVNKSPWFIALAVVVLGLWIWRKGMPAAKWTVVLVLSLAMSDLVAYRLVKPLVHRERPPQAGVPIIVRGYKHTGNSFPSNHATNIFAAATVISGGVPVLTIPVFIFAAAIGYSRVYVGAHFPGDVLAGAILGTLISVLLRILLRDWLKSDGYFSRARTEDRSSSNEGAPPGTKKEPYKP